MEKKPGSDFVVETIDHCFICLKPTTSSPQLSSSNPKTESASKPINHSLQCLSQFLKVDRKKVFIGIGEDSISPQLLAKVEKSRLMAGLCKDCACLNESFSKLCRRLEKIRMEMLSDLSLFYGKMLAAEKIGPTDLSSREDLKGKLEVAAVLRKETIQKCSVKLSKAQPKIKVEQLTPNAILKLRRKFTNSSREKASSSRNLTAAVISDTAKMENQNEISNDDEDHFEDTEQANFSTGMYIDDDNPIGSNSTVAQSEPSADYHPGNVLENAMSTDSGKFVTGELGRSPSLESSLPPVIFFREQDDHDHD